MVDKIEKMTKDEQRYVEKFSNLEAILGLEVLGLHVGPVLLEDHLYLEVRSDPVLHFPSALLALFGLVGLVAP